MRLSVLAVSLAFLTAAASAQSSDGEPFRVFFDWSKPELTRDAQATLDEAVAAFLRMKPSRIIVAGHADRSGPAAVNLAASRRRAEAVKSWLVDRGVPASAIQVSAYGESRPIIATEDGVREAQNRRVEISFTGFSVIAVPTVPLVRSDGSVAGSVARAGNRLIIDTTGLSPGSHGLHLHAAGRCEGPDFTSAGPHWNPTNRKHGSDNPDGPHLGDLPNLTIGADGRGSVTLAVPPGFVDADGTAVVIHAAPDDNRTDPSGNSGARIACAALTP
jgi:Cu-Zn family superoxide dismutase